jgi:hypothetical protein
VALTGVARPLALYQAFSTSKPAPNA